MKLNLAIVLALASIATTTATAQNYPSQPVTWVVPYPAGGVTDNGARTVAKVLGEKLGQPVIIDNKPGAGGIVGTEYVVNGKKDGYTFVYSSNGTVSYPFLFKKLSFDPRRDLIPVHGMAYSPMLVIVRADSPFKTFADLIDYAKKNPEKLNFASTGQGTTPHLLAELIQKEAGVRMTHIPYKGLAPALTDLLGGSIDITFDFPIIMKPMIEAGKVRALGISGEQRLPNMPDVKTLAEQGYPGAVLAPWAAIQLAAGTPQPIVDKLAEAFGKALEDPSIVKYFADQGAGVMQGVSKEKLVQFFDGERVKMKEIIERAGIQPE